MVVRLFHTEDHKCESIVLTEMSKSLNCPCRLCEVYIDGVGSCNSIFTCQVLHACGLFFSFCCLLIC